MSDYNKNLITAQKIAAAVNEAGGTAYYVGGYVRDRLLGIDNKDIDIEIHGVAPDKLERILNSLGSRITIGESFGIYALKGCDVDIALPRKETATGRGHRDFDIIADPFIGPQKAASRRDFTVNALMENVLTGEILDYFGGREDLNNKILRHVSDASFGEDPLRVLRGAQFAARFGFTVAPETVELCSRMDLTALPKERVEAELRKALLKSCKPSVFFEVLREENALDYWFPEVKALWGVEQNPARHPEGGVWEHTMLVLDMAVRYRDKVNNPAGLMYSALCHDFGKPATTAFIKGAIHTYDHETVGVPIASAFMSRLTGEKELIRFVLNMVENHMVPHSVEADSSPVKKTNRMFDRTVDPYALICVAMSDAAGTLPPAEKLREKEAFLLERLDIYNEYMSRPFVSGKDLIDSGLTPGGSFSEILDYAHKLRLAGIDKESALKQTLAYARKLK